MHGGIQPHAAIINRIALVDFAEEIIGFAGTDESFIDSGVFAFRIILAAYKFAGQERAILRVIDSATFASGRDGCKHSEGCDSFALPAHLCAFVNRFVSPIALRVVPFFRHIAQNVGRNDAMK